MKVYNTIIGAILLTALVESINIQPRIINGYHGMKGQFPYHVGVTAKLSNGQEIMCNGALVASDVVLTVAQCLIGIKSVTIGLGSIVRNTPPIVMISKNFTTHPDYNSTNLANNIGIIHLPAGLSETKSLQIIRLPSQSQLTSDFLDYVGFLTGFGRLDDSGPPSLHLRYTKVKIVPKQKCQDLYGINVANSNTLCTLGVDFNSQGACANDNGAPLVIAEGKKKTLIGLISFISSRGCESGDPNGLVRIGGYVKWISEEAKIPIRY